MNIPPISGFESRIKYISDRKERSNQVKDLLKYQKIKSAFACALHMHQPTIPAGKDGELISHLQYMFDHKTEGDNHNAEPFAQCYRRLANIIPKLVEEGYNPKIMLDYSGNLLWGIEQMGREDILTSLKFLTSDETIKDNVEWLGTFWSHAVASSTPTSDFKLQISAWQHHFCTLFGEDALQRVKGFSLPEMHLPNHPDALYELIKAINECGYQWLIVQEDSVENLDGSRLRDDQKYIPNVLQAKNTNGYTVSILSLIKTQGSDTKLIGQMQPYYEALGLSRQRIDNKDIPTLVTQIADGENGGVMMNEFPKAFIETYKKIGSKIDIDSTIPMNGSEYIDLLELLNIRKDRLPTIQAIHQHKVWNKVSGTINTKSIEKAINELKTENHSFSMSGASWTNNLNWEEGYQNVLDPIKILSSKFHQTFDHIVQQDILTKEKSYQEALLHLLLLETSCFRYWGQGKWTDYAKTIYKRGLELIESFSS